MHEFSPDEAKRWNAWQHATAVSARRSDLVCRAIAATTLTASVIAVVVAFVQR